MNPDQDTNVHFYQVKSDYSHSSRANIAAYLVGDKSAAFESQWTVQMNTKHNTTFAMRFSHVEKLNMVCNKKGVPVLTDLLMVMKSLYTRL